MAGSIIYHNFQITILFDTFNKINYFHWCHKHYHYYGYCIFQVFRNSGMHAWRDGRKNKKEGEQHIILQEIVKCVS